MTLSLELGAQTLQGELWIRTDTLKIPDPDTDIQETSSILEKERQAIATLMEDARWAFSGMIYGFNLIWTPSAQSRGIKEFLEIKPVALIPRNDPRLSATFTIIENELHFIHLEYQMSQIQQNRFSGWQSPEHPTAGGIGFVYLFEDAPRRQAMKEAIKESIRGWLRAREYNRPQEVRGRVALVNFPKTGLLGTKIHATVNIALEFDLITHYGVD